MKTWDQFYPFIAVDVMGCPYPLIDNQLRLAARDFCRRSGVWRAWADPFTADGTGNRFDYDLASGQELVKVARALRNDRPMLVKAGSALPDNWQTGGAISNTWLPWFGSTRVQDTLIHFDNEVFMVFPKPLAGDVITCELVFKPAMNATGVGDIVYDDYADEVASGAKAKLLMMSKEPWADQGQALFHRSLFEQAIHRAANSDLERTGKTARRTAKAGI